MAARLTMILGRLKVARRLGLRGLQAIRVGSVKDGKLTAFIPQTDPAVGAPEGLGVDDDGNIYGAYQAQHMVRKFVKG
jgi:hypothetical protein